MPVLSQEADLIDMPNNKESGPKPKQLPSQMKDWEGSSAYVVTTPLVIGIDLVMYRSFWWDSALGITAELIKQLPFVVAWSLLVQCGMLNLRVAVSSVVFVKDGQQVQKGQLLRC